MTCQIALVGRAVAVDHLEEPGEVAVAVERQRERVDGELLLGYEHHGRRLFGTRTGDQVLISEKTADHHGHHDQRRKQRAAVVHDKTLDPADSRLNSHFGILGLRFVFLRHNCFRKLK